MNQGSPDCRGSGESPDLGDLPVGTSRGDPPGDPQGDPQGGGGWQEAGRVVIWQAPLADLAGREASYPPRLPFLRPEVADADKTSRCLGNYEKRDKILWHLNVA